MSTANAKTIVAAIILTIGSAACSGGGGSSLPSSVPAAPQQPSPGGGTPQSQTIDASDQAAAASATHLLRHTAGTLPKGTKPSSNVYPADMQYYGGAVLQSSTPWNLYVDSSPGTFGKIKQFEADYSNSAMIHLTDEYVAATGNNRYAPGKDYGVNYTAYTALADNDILAIVHHFAKSNGAGYGNMYNVFLPQGIDVCFTGLAACNASFTSPAPAFCGYHASVDYEDIGHVLFAVIPYQEPLFCGQPSNGPTPNGAADNTYSALSHEETEMITDPDVGFGWLDLNVGVNGEIGDLCAYLPETVTLSSHQYYLQREYSNAQHACADSGN